MASDAMLKLRIYNSKFETEAANPARRMQSREKKLYGWLCTPKFTPLPRSDVDKARAFE